MSCPWRCKSATTSSLSHRERRVPMAVFVICLGPCVPIDRNRKVFIVSIPNCYLPVRVFCPAMPGVCLGIPHAVDVDSDAKRGVPYDVRPPKANACWRPIHEEAGFDETNESVLAWPSRQNDCALQSWSISFPGQNIRHLDSVRRYLSPIAGLGPVVGTMIFAAVGNSRRR